jgi:S1-C subfamily serine protease
LDTTVTTGVVSAVNREFRAGTARTPANTPIRNVVQTDAAINPGNSGGPLLNLKGRVVGINTAIVTTSGSSAGIGFAVPSDQLQPVVQRIVREDRQKQQTTSRAQGWLGVSVLRQPIRLNNYDNDDEDDEDENNNRTATVLPMARLQNWITRVERNSPASDAGLRSLRIVPETGSVQYGDAIVAVGGNEVSTLEELQSDLATRVVGEQVALTVESDRGERRVVYVTLSERP